MSKWKNGFKKMIVFIVTVVLAAGSAGSYMLLPVRAEEIATEDGNHTSEGTEGEQYRTDTIEDTGDTEPDGNTDTDAAEPASEDGQPEEIAGTEDTSLEDDAPKDEVEETVSVTDELSDLPDNDELLMDYFNRLLYEDRKSDISTFGNVGEIKLTDANEKKIYRQLKAAIEKIAAGTGTSTVISVSGFQIASSACEEIVSRVLSYLLMDCPYDLYWYDKTNTGGVRYGYSMSSSGYINEITFTFKVAADYRGNNETTLNSSKINTVNQSASNAKDIVNDNKGKSDREKLDSYCKKICELVSYNYDALNENVLYGDPWQLIYVFDNNEKTDVVCEGYSKAFQYLCDLSDFTGNTVCYTVTGFMGGGTGSGGHMWNIVTLEKKNYLVDVTNSDKGSVGQDGSLFLATPKSGTVDTDYTFSNNSGQSIKYKYDAEQIKLFGKKILYLSAPNEPNPGTGTAPGTGTTSSTGTTPGPGNGPKPNPGTITKPTVPSSKSVTLSLNGQKLKKNATLKVTFKKKYKLKATVTGTSGKTITGGNAKITWSTSNKKIATVSAGGKVTVKKKTGTVTITARTADGKVAKVRLKAGKSAVKVTKVKITGSKSMSLKAKKTQTLKATVSPASAANQKVTWKSSNKKIATVNSKGKVTAKKAGKVTITATAKDGSKKKAKIKIKIKK